MGTVHIEKNIAPGEEHWCKARQACWRCKVCYERPVCQGTGATATGSDTDP